MKQKAEMIFEELETVILRQSDSFLMGFCPRCQATVQLMTAEVLAMLSGGTEREIFRLLEAGRIHFVETRRLYACPNCYGKSLDGTELHAKHNNPLRLEE